MSNSSSTPGIPSIQTSSAQTSNGSRTPTSGDAMPNLGLGSTTPNRRQHPPSPLSKIARDHAEQEDRVPTIPLPSPAGESSHRSLLSEANGILESSPCFIHSQLDKHANGSLQDWLKNKSGNRNATNPHYQHQIQQHHHHHHHHHPQQHHAHRPVSHTAGAKLPSHDHHSHGSDAPSSTSGTTQTSSSSSTISPTGTGGYETDPSSLAGGFDGDEDDEERGSLTKQLAETAQGVREMSRELGEGDTQNGRGLH